MELNHGDLAITSPVFGGCDAIPARFSNADGDTSPELRWTEVPQGTVELVLVMHDPDAPLANGFTHWVATGIDPASNSLPEGATEGFTPGLNTVGEPVYMGPAPPPGHGTHHYFFHLFAVDTEIEAGLDRAALLERLEGHIIEQARLVGTYELT